jgi:hypothetical protein
MPPGAAESLTATVTTEIAATTETAVTTETATEAH